MEKDFEQILKDEELIGATRTANVGAGFLCAIVGVAAFTISYVTFQELDALSWNSFAFAVLFWIAFILSMWSAKLDEQERKQRRMNLQIVKAVKEIREKLEMGETGSKD